MLGAETIGELRIGIARADRVKMLGDPDQKCEIASAEVYFDFYREPGITVRHDRGRGAEIVIARVLKR